jgi:hypothetical protein
MKKTSKIFVMLLMIATTVGIVFAADHIDAPSVTSTSSDITDYYAFQSPSDNNNMVFVANLQGLMSPTATADARFDENVMIEFNIDNTGDAIEDLVIQAVFNEGMITAYGPVIPRSTGTQSMIEADGPITEAEISMYSENITIGENNGIKVFAGPRDDPFFMDFAQYGEIIAGNATGFNDPGSDTFAGTNVLSVIIEVPKSLLGEAATINTWVESKRKI